jgi:iron-sulfur cluster assembly protein
MDIADAVGANDVLYESCDAQVIVDRDTLQYLDGTKVDFRREGLSESFKFDNPNVAAECGCGESFSVEKNAGTLA